MSTLETTHVLIPPAEAAKRLVVRLGWVTAMVLATAAASQVAVPLPFTPVPLTLQVFAVLLTGLILRPGEALVAQATYVGLGLSGLPWFAGLQSLPIRAAMGSASFGYLVGFVIAAPVVALLHDRVGPWRAVGAGLALIYAVGATHLALVTSLDANAAVVLGVFPFIPVDLFKALLAIRVAAFLKRSGERLPS